MGFEQLAELKKQLAAARAESAPAAKSGNKPAPAAQSGNKPGNKPGNKSGAARKPAPPRRSPAQAVSAGTAQAKPADAKPVDPVVKSIGRLQKRFPNVFPKNPAPKFPLKVGIFEDLIVHSKDLSLSEAELRDAIKTWCRGSRYWKSLVEGAARVDLTGAAAGVVTAQEAAGAQRLQAHRAGKSAAKAAGNAAAAAVAANVDSDPASTPTDAAAQPQAESHSAPQSESQAGNAQANDATQSTHSAVLSENSENMAESDGASAASAPSTDAQR